MSFLQAEQRAVFSSEDFFALKQKRKKQKRKKSRKAFFGRNQGGQFRQPFCAKSKCAGIWCFEQKRDNSNSQTEL